MISEFNTIKRKYKKKTKFFERQKICLQIIFYILHIINSTIFQSLSFLKFKSHIFRELFIFFFYWKKSLK